MRQVAQAMGGTLRQHQPIVPVAKSVLHSPELGNELLGLRGLGRELGGVTSPLGKDAVLMQQFLRWGTLWPWRLFQQMFCNR